MLIKVFVVLFNLKIVLNCVIKMLFKLVVVVYKGMSNDNSMNWKIGVLFK